MESELQEIREELKEIKTQLLTLSEKLDPSQIALLNNDADSLDENTKEQLHELFYFYLSGKRKAVIGR